MNYQVSLTVSAEKELNALPAKMIARIVPRLEALATAPRPPGCKKLKGGESEWRIRVGDYRAVYEVDDTARTLDVTRPLLTAGKSTSEARARRHNFPRLVLRYAAEKMTPRHRAVVLAK